MPNSILNPCRTRHLFWSPLGGCFFPLGVKAGSLQVQRNDFGGVHLTEMSWVKKKQTMGRTVYLLTLLVDFYGKLVNIPVFMDLNWFIMIYIPSLKLTFSPFKIDGWKISRFLLGPLGLFSGKNWTVFWGVITPISIIFWRWISQIPYRLLFKLGRHVSRKKKTDYFPWNTGWLIGILIMAYHNSNITG